MLGPAPSIPARFRVTLCTISPISGGGRSSARRCSQSGRGSRQRSREPPDEPRPSWWSSPRVALLRRGGRVPARARHLPAPALVARRAARHRRVRRRLLPRHGHAARQRHAARTRTSCTPSRRACRCCWPRSVSIGRIIGTRYAHGRRPHPHRVRDRGATPGSCAFLLRRRGIVPALVGGVALALFPMAVAADKTLMLEPYLLLFCLLGTTVLFTGDDLASRRRLLFAGVVFGFACTLKLWAVLPAGIALVCCLPRWRDRARPLFGGLAAGFLVPVTAVLRVGAEQLSPRSRRRSSSCGTTPPRPRRPPNA